jgi:hypothetical protein
MKQISIEELKAKAGKSWLTLTYPIERGMVQRFVEAMGDSNPRWQGNKPETPPSLLLTLGFEKVISRLLSLPEAVLHGSTELECFEPVKVGDVITVTAKVSAVRERPPATFINLELEQHNQKGVLVARCKQLAVLRSTA